MSEHIRVSVADGVCTVAMHRPEKKNALTRDMYLGLAEAIQRSAADPEVRCLLLTGTAEVFCAGNDIGEVLLVLRLIGLAGRGRRSGGCDLADGGLGGCVVDGLALALEDVLGRGRQDTMAISHDPYHGSQRV